MLSVCEAGAVAPCIPGNVATGHVMQRISPISVLFLYICRPLQGRLKTKSIQDSFCYCYVCKLAHTILLKSAKQKKNPRWDPDSVL